MANPVTIPDLIRVERHPDGLVQVLVDGVALPWGVSREAPIQVEVDREGAPGVRLTLLAAQVNVADHRFEPGAFGAHSPTRMRAPLEVAAELAPDHPALRWQCDGDGCQHRRVLGDGASTACGLAGSLTLVDAAAPRCDQGCWA